MTDLRQGGSREASHVPTYGVGEVVGDAGLIAGPLIQLGIGEDTDPRLSDLLDTILYAVQRIQGEYGPVLTSHPGLNQDIGRISGAVIEALQIAQEQRGQSFRVAQLGEMTAVLAHEVRRPLASIVHGVQCLCDELDLEGEAEQYARFILESSRGVNRLLRDVLLISRPQRVELVVCDLPAILEGLLRIWRPQAVARGVEVRTFYAEDLQRPVGDPARLEQVFANLISNALDAMGEGGTLWIRAWPAQLPPLVPHQSTCPAVRVAVEDTGMGIPAHQLQQIFEPFFTTRQDRTGLGLAIARRIVSDHRGRIEVESEEMRGTRFTVTLPLSEE
jgi:signal transduction histidine kinase